MQIGIKQKIIRGTECPPCRAINTEVNYYQRRIVVGISVNLDIWDLFLAPAGFICEVSGNHRGRDGINSSAGADRAGILIDLTDFDETGASAGITLLASGVEAFAVAISAAMGVVRRDAAVVHPAASAALRAGLRRTKFGRDFSFFGLHLVSFLKVCFGN